MLAAFTEYKFGNGKYESVKDSGKDKALVFTDWSNLTREDRNLVYFKGAYVIYLLRMELGEKDFWKGIKFYSQKYFDKSINILDFQKALEESTGRDLNAFFNQWVYE